MNQKNIFKQIILFTFEGLVNFVRNTEVTAVAFWEWVSSAEKQGFIVHWFETYKQKIPKKGSHIYGEAERYSAALGNLMKEGGVPDVEEMNMGEVAGYLKDSVTIQERKIGIEFIMYMSTLSAIIMALIIVPVNLWIDDRLSQRLEEFVAEIDKYVNQMKVALKINDKESLVDSIDSLLTVVFSFNKEVKSKRKYKNLHPDMDASFELSDLVDKAGNQYFEVIHDLIDGKRIDYKIVKSQIQADLIDPAVEWSQHLDSFIIAVEAMEEPTRRFKQVRHNLRKN